jgi:hypothetical protein
VQDGGVARAPSAGLAENHLNFRFAEGLGSRWRFFATYVGV